MAQQNYQYATEAGGLGTVMADSPESAIANAKGIAKNSGVSLAQPTIAPTPVNNVNAAQLGTNPTTYSTYFPTPTAHANLAETALASKDAYLANTAKEADQLTQTQDTGKVSIADAFAALSGTATERANLYDSAGINEDKKSIDELTSQMESRSRSYDKQIQAVRDSNPTGALSSGVDIEVNRLSQQKASELADLGIVLNAKTRNYDTAKGIVDQKVDAETEDLKNKLTGLQFFYSENASNLSDDKKTLLNEKIDAADKEYTEAKELRTKIGDLQLAAAKNGAPVSVVRAIGASQDITGATSAAGGYLKSGTGGGTFTTTQLNGGAANAGLPISAFNDLTADDKNYFINGYSVFSAALKQVQAGTATTDDLKAAIDAAPLSQTAKDILYTKGGIDTTESSGGGAGGFFSNALNFVGSLFGA